MNGSAEAPHAAAEAAHTPAEAAHVPAEATGPFDSESHDPTGGSVEAAAPSVSEFQDPTGESAGDVEGAAEPAEAAPGQPPELAEGAAGELSELAEGGPSELSELAEGGPSELSELAEGGPSELSELARVVEALLFLSSDPLTIGELADATRADQLAVAAALELLAEQYAPGRRGLQLRELAGGYTFASDPLSDDAARRLFSRPRAATLTPAQAETLAIVAYLQPISRPEITRIRGVSADSATSTLLERGLIEEAGRSQFGAVLYRTGTHFLKLFGLGSLAELPDVAKWDPTPEEQAELRERLLRAGEARAEGGPSIEDRPPLEQ